MLDHARIEALETMNRRASAGAVSATPTPWWKNGFVLGGAAIGAFWGFEGGDPGTYGETTPYAIGTRLGAAVLGAGLGTLAGYGAKQVLG